MLVPETDRNSSFSKIMLAFIPYKAVPLKSGEGNIVKYQNQGLVKKNVYSSCSCTVTKISIF
jgi:hypothetical protein